ncbi:MAG: SRPBCC domain-containing protein [Micromonosporaceae bacterium]|nr:SRPBCC domain-containing protein [Micromonosporaceae bacterium]
MIAVEPERLLRYTWRNGPLDTVVTWRLVPEGHGTRVLLEHHGFDLTRPCPATRVRRHERRMAQSGLHQARPPPRLRVTVRTSGQPIRPGAASALVCSDGRAVRAGRHGAHVAESEYGDRSARFPMAPVSGWARRTRHGRNGSFRLRTPRYRSASSRAARAYRSDDTEILTTVEQVSVVPRFVVTADSWRLPIGRRSI